MSDVLDVKAIRERGFFVAYEEIDPRVLGDLSRCLDVIEQMVGVIKKLDHHGVALIARAYEPGSRTVRELVDEAHSVLCLVKL